MYLTDALGLAERELVAFVGAGGKKTAMGRLVTEADTRNLAVGYTTTVGMPPPDYPLVVAPPARIVDELEERPSPIAFASERVSNPERVDEKVRGFSPATIDRLFESGRFDRLLVKADGARMREFKAPGDGEPPIPPASTVVVPVASVRAVGEPLSAAVVHRPERVTAITDLPEGEPIRPETIGAVIASPRGGLKNVPETASVVPIVNKADTPDPVDTAERVLEAAFDRSERLQRGLITSFRNGTIRAIGAG